MTTLKYRRFSKEIKKKHNYILVMEGLLSLSLSVYNNNYYEKAREKEGARKCLELKISPFKCVLCIIRNFVITRLYYIHSVYDFIRFKYN